MGVPNLESRVHKLLRERLGIGTKEIDINARLREDLGMDSLDGVQLIIAAEVEFDVVISDKQVDALQTVSDLITLIETLPPQSGAT